MDELSTSIQVHCSPSHTSQAPGRDVLSYLEPSMMAWKELKEDHRAIEKCHVSIGIRWCMMSLPQCSAYLYIVVYIIGVCIFLTRHIIHMYIFNMTLTTYNYIYDIIWLIYVYIYIYIYIHTYDCIDTCSIVRTRLICPQKGSARRCWMIGLFRLKIATPQKLKVHSYCNCFRFMRASSKSSAPGASNPSLGAEPQPGHGHWPHWGQSCRVWREEWNWWMFIISFDLIW